MTSQPVPEGVDPREYRRVVGRFATGIAIVTTCQDGEQHAMTVNSFTSVSLDPLLVLFCCEKVARFHEAVMASGTWAVSVLSGEQQEASRWFATRGRPFAGQFARFPHRRASVVDAFVFERALASVECRTVGTYDGGDHTIVVGEVVALETPRPEAEPLLYYEGDYRTLGR